MFEPFQPVQGGIGLKRNKSDIGVIFPQASSCVDEGACGAQFGGEMRDAPFGLVPDFDTPCFVMGLPVGRVVILIGIVEPFGVLDVELACHADSAIGAFEEICKDNFGSIGFENAFAFGSIFAGMQSVTPNPRAAPSMAKAIPVLPDVASNKRLLGEVARLR